MSKVVHFDTGICNRYTHTMICGIHLSTTGVLDIDKSTNQINRVTCPECLKKLGIKPKPAVDEQKREMAEFIIKNYVYISPVTEKYRCLGCQDRTSPFSYFKKDIKHKPNCIVVGAKEYLEGLEDE